MGLYNITIKGEKYYKTKAYKVFPITTCGNGEGCLEEARPYLPIVLRFFAMSFFIVSTLAEVVNPSSGVFMQ